MPRGFRSHRMDQTKIWHYNCFVFESSNVRLTLRRFGYELTMYFPISRLITLFLYMVAELSALQSIVNSLTGLNGLPVVIVQCAVTTIYTCVYMYCLIIFHLPNHFVSSWRISHIFYHRQYPRSHGRRSHFRRGHLGWGGD